MLHLHSRNHSECRILHKNFQRLLLTRLTAWRCTHGLVRIREGQSQYFFFIAQGYLISNPVPCSHWYHFSVGIRISRFIFVILTSKLTSHLHSQTHFGIPFYRFRYYNGSWIFMFAKACKQNMSNVVNWWVFQ